MNFCGQQGCTEPFLCFGCQQLQIEKFNCNRWDCLSELGDHSNPTEVKHVLGNIIFFWNQQAVLGHLYFVGKHVLTTKFNSKKKTCFDGEKKKEIDFKVKFGFCKHFSASLQVIDGVPAFLLEQDHQFSVELVRLRPIVTASRHGRKMGVRQENIFLVMTGFCLERVM